jgi:hypothetical protein
MRQYYRKRAADYDKRKARTWEDERGFVVKVINYIVEPVRGAGRLGLEVGSGRRNEGSK